MSKEDLSKAKELAETVSQLSGQARELIATYAEGMLAGLKLGRESKNETVSEDESKDA